MSTERSHARHDGHTQDAAAAGLTRIAAVATSH